MHNFEFKGRLDDPKAAMARARKLGADLYGDLRQNDTYFRVPSGRLKLRETAGHQAELIFYHRDEEGSNRASDYEIAHSAEPDALRVLLSDAMGVLAVVKKRRTLLSLDASRIHLDNVEGLGHFLEFEVIVDGDVAKQRIDGLIREMGFEWSDCIRASYLDLTLAARET
ncbi:MAG TPA: class IV adenylate cyclase [Dehalococcoidia bacterium]|nr:class IV adenylate cyclase [Dehalococcoidia bacterium]